LRPYTQDFHDRKVVEGLGQQQVRAIWANVGAFHLLAEAHPLTALWAWDRPREAIGDRSDAPCEDAARRPSPADRRQALQRRWRGQAFQRLAGGQPLAPEIQERVGRAIRHVARPLGLLRKCRRRIQTVESRGSLGYAVGGVRLAS